MNELGRNSLPSLEFRIESPVDGSRSTANPLGTYFFPAVDCPRQLPFNNPFCIRQLTCLREEDVQPLCLLSCRIILDHSFIAQAVLLQYRLPERCSNLVPSLTCNKGRCRFSSDASLGELEEAKEANLLE